MTSKHTDLNDDLTAPEAAQLRQAYVALKA